MILRDTVVEVDLRAIGANMDAICQMVGPDVAVMPVVTRTSFIIVCASSLAVRL